MKSRKKLIKTILPALLCAMALLMAACGAGGSTPGHDDEGGSQQAGIRSA